MAENSWKVPESGEKIGDYTLDQEIGRGYEGVVFQASDRSGKKIALKVFGLEWWEYNKKEGVDLSKKLHDELSKVDSPFVVKVVDYLVEEDNHCVVMELVEGITLAELVEEQGGRISWTSMASHAEKIARGLKASDEVGVSHGDLNETQIIVQNSSGDLKIIDFCMDSKATRLEEDLGKLASIIFRSITGKSMITDFSILLRESSSDEEAYNSDLIEKGVQLGEESDRAIQAQGYTVPDYHFEDFQRDWFPFEAFEIVVKLKKFGEPDGYQNIEEVVADLQKAANQTENTQGLTGKAVVDGKPQVGENTSHAVTHGTDLKFSTVFQAPSLV